MNKKNIVLFSFVIILQIGYAQNTVLNKDTVSILLKESGESIFEKESPKSNDIMFFLKNRDKKTYWNLMRKFHGADIYYEALLYCIVAANKLEIYEANMGVATCLSESLNCPNLGTNSKEITLYYLNRWKCTTNSQKADRYINFFQSTPAKDSIEYPYIDNKSSEIRRLKTGSLKGNTDDYLKLKEIMLHSDMYGSFLYYAYIMADRYFYKPAKKDMVDIINRFFSEHDLGEIDDETRKICEYFQ